MYRNFVEAMMRLRRDQINISKKEIPVNLELKFADDEVITFDVENLTWNIFSKRASFNFSRWNPVVSEIIKFVDLFNVKEMNFAIENLNKLTNSVYSTMDSVLLLPQFMKILNELKKPENESKNVVFDKYCIAWDSGLNEFLMLDGNTNSTGYIINIDHVIPELMKKVTYANVIQGLNECYASIKH